MSKAPAARCSTRKRQRARCAIAASSARRTSSGDALAGSPVSRFAGIPGDRKYTSCMPRVRVMTTCPPIPTSCSASVAGITLPGPPVESV